MECTAATAEDRNRGGKRSFTDARASGDVAPIPAVRRVTIEPLESTHTRPSAYAAAMNRTPLSSGARLIEFSQRQSDLQPRVIDGFMEGQASSASAHLLKRGGAQRLSTA